MRHTIFLPALLLLAAVPARAQDLIRVGQTLTGELSSSDPTYEGGDHYDRYRFDGRAGQWYTVTLRSEDFDAYLHVGSRPPHCDDCAEDDDGAGGLDAQVRYRARADGRHEIYVTSFSGGEGRYRLTLEHAATDTSTYDVTADTVAIEPPHDAMPLLPVLLPVDVPVDEMLDPSDPRNEEGAFYDQWDYYASAGESIVLSMESDQFDAMVLLGRSDGGAWEEVSRDDDGGQGTNAELRHTFDVEGFYAVRATSYLPAVGEYVLLLRSNLEPRARAPLDLDTFSVSVAPLAHGRDVQGELSRADAPDGGRPQDLYHFPGRAGEVVTITLESPRFDAYLVLEVVGSWQKVATDDDGGGGTNARITVTLPVTGEYLVRATSFDAGETGPYTLRLDRR